MEKLISWYKSNSVFVWTLLIAIGVIVFGAAYSSTLGEISGAFMSWVSYYFGWLYILSIVAFIGFCLWISLSKYGSVKLGGDDEKPEFSTFSWYAMLFCGSTGIGLVFWSIAEPLSHYAAPPFGIQAGYRFLYPYLLSALGYYSMGMLCCSWLRRCLFPVP